MNQFPTAFMGGYRKDLVDERLKELVTQIEELQKEVEASKEREEQAKESLKVSENKAEILEAELKAAQEVKLSAEPVTQREEQLKAELASALKQLEELGADGQSADSAADREEARCREDQRKQDLSAALRWSESLEAELKLAREERAARSRNRLLELENTKALNQRILDLEAERERQEALHRRELSRLQEQLAQRDMGCEAAGRILETAREEAAALLEKAQERAQELEQQAEEELYAKRRAAAKTLEGARTQVIHYLETFTVTRDKLSVTYDELDALVGQIPKAEGTIFELGRDDPDAPWDFTAGSKK